MLRDTYAEINLKALEYNLEILKKEGPKYVKDLQTRTKYKSRSGD